MPLKILTQEKKSCKAEVPTENTKLSKIERFSGLNED